MSRRAVRIACAALLAAGSAAVTSVTRAQGGVASEGALFVLIPVGARAVGQGQAVAASRLGSDGIWWNPAALGWATKRELSAHYVKNFILTGNAADFVQPAGRAGRAGVVGASLLYINLGEEAATDEFGNTIGMLYSRALALSASYAATFGDRVAAGVSYKFINQVQSCSGACQGLATFNLSASLFDFGMHAIVDKARSLTIGAAIKNAGFCIQTIDAEQCDPAPTRLHLGADFDVKRVATALPGATLRLSAEVVARRGEFSSPVTRAGAEAAFANTFFLRGGAYGGSLDGSNAVVGIGFRRGTIGFDFARTFGGLSADAGEPPTYVTFRMAFR